MGFTKTAKCLIENGAAVNTKVKAEGGFVSVGGLSAKTNINGWTPLHLAAHIALFPIDCAEAHGSLLIVCGTVE